MKLKNIILTVFSATIILNSCSLEISENRYHKKTTSGAIAYQYVLRSVKQYADFFIDMQHFNEYIEQTSSEKRDSIYLNYFYNTKISYHDENNSWILYSSDYENRNVKVNTNNKYITEDGAEWNIVLNYNPYADTVSLRTSPMPYEFKPYSITLKNIGDNTYTISKHQGYFDYDFNTTSEWTIKVTGKNLLQIEGSGTMFSYTIPALKLDFTITTPISCESLSYIYNLTAKNYYPYIIGGSVEILATDVNKNTTEKTAVEISEQFVVIFYNGNKESWNISELP